MKRAFTEKLVMIAELTIRPDRLEAFLDYTTENLKISRSYPGNVAFDMLIDETRPETVLFYEVWESAEVQKAYMAWRLESGDVTRLISYLAVPPKFTAFRSILAPT